MTCAVLLVLLVPDAAGGQTTPTQRPPQLPKTAPQVAQVLPSYEGQNVASVELAGQPDLDPAKYLPLLAQRVGEPFAQKKVDESIAALKRTGQFQDVQLEVRPDPNGIRVLLVLQPAMYFGIFEFPGAVEHFSYSRLLQVTNYPPRGEYTPVDVSQAQEALQKFLKRSGYFQSQVRTEVQTDKQHGLANLIFHVTLNRRAKFGNVSITGTSPLETARLQHTLRSVMARLRGSAIRAGKNYRYKTLQNASQYLENQLTKRDLLAAKVHLVGANYNPETNRADITFHVQPGPVVHVKVVGAHLWSWQRHKLLPVYAQIGVDPELIQEGRQNLISFLQSKGYFDANVTSQVQQQATEETIVYNVVKGPKHKVVAVGVAGNQHIPEKEVLAHVKVQKGNRFLFFSHGKYSERLVRSSVKNLEALYQSEGFSQAKVTPQVKDQGGKILVTFRVDEGPQDIVEALRLDGNNTLPQSQLAPQGLKLEPGKPYSQKRADEDRTQIMTRYLERGYLTATFRETVRNLPKQPHRLEVVYHIYEGPQVRTASIITLGRKHTRQKLIARNIPEIQVEKPLSEGDLLTAESRLYGVVGVFDWATIDPRRQITTQTEEDVVVKVHEAKRNSLTYGFGFEVINRGGSVPGGTIAVPGIPPVGLPSKFKTSQKTFYGPRGTLEYTRNNLRGKGESITLSGLAGRLDQRANITYTDPTFRWTNWSENVTLSGEHNSQNPIFSSRQAEFDYQLQRPLDPKKTQNLFVRYSLSQTGLTRLLIPDLVPASDQHVRLSTFSGTYNRDTRDNSLDAHKGIYESFELDISPKVLGSTASLGKLLAQAAYYKKLPAGLVWANSLRLGVEVPFAGSHIPISQKFFSGGGSTLRGFPLNGAGPQRTIVACGNPADKSTCVPITVPVGGNQLVILNSEFRIPTHINKNLSVVTFYDGGNVFQRVGFHDFWGNYTNSVGLGLRYATPVGPVRIDVGHNLSPVPGIKSTQYFITLGQAF